MKKLRKIASLLLAMVMVLSLGVSVMAADYTITITNSVEGKTYNAYKLFDATTDGTNVSYTISDSTLMAVLNVDGSPFTFSSNDNSLYYVTVKDNYTYTVGEGADSVTYSGDVAVTEWLQANKDAIIAATTSAGSVTGNGSTVTITVSKEGYYFVTTSNGSAITITTITSNVSIQDKTTTPGSLTKTVSGGESYSIGDPVSYVITADVPLYNGSSEKVTSYTFTDTLPLSLTLSGTVTVTIKDASGNAVNSIVIDATVIDATETTGQIINVSFNPTAYEDYPENATIEISYTAILNSNAEYENVNTVVSNFDSTGVTETVYTYGFTLNKTDEDGNALSGAEFVLKNSNGTEIIVSEVEEGVYEVTSATSGDTITAGTNVKIFGLAEGTYTLTETKAPDGYNLLTSPTSIIISAENADEDGYAATVTVENSTGSTLPSTGGIGTTIFYVLGSIMVLGAAVVLITRRRMGKAE